MIEKISNKGNTDKERHGKRKNEELMMRGKSSGLDSLRIRRRD